VLYPLSYGGSVFARANLILDSHHIAPLPVTLLLAQRSFAPQLLLSDSSLVRERAPRVRATESKQAATTSWRFYQTLFLDALQDENAAPRTIETDGLAVQQLGGLPR
jgi:hypothetical protein